MYTRVVTYSQRIESEWYHSKTYSLSYQFLPSLFYLKWGLGKNFDLGVTLPGHAPYFGIKSKYRIFNSGISGAISADFSYAFSEIQFLSISPRVIISNEKKGMIPFALNIGASFDSRLDREGGNSVAIISGFGIPLYLSGNKRVRIMPQLSYVHVLKMNRVFMESYELPFYEGLKNIFHFGISISFKSR